MKQFWFLVADFLGWLGDFLDRAAMASTEAAWHASQKAFNAPPKGWREGHGPRR